MRDTIDELLESHHRHFLKMSAMMFTGGIRIMSEGQDITKDILDEHQALINNLETTIKRRGKRDAQRP